MMFRKPLSRALLAVMLCLTALSTLAQEDQPPAIPSEEDSAIMDELGEQAVAEWEREFLRRSVYDFRIAYLVAPDALPDDHIVSGRMVTELTGAQVFGDWETFAAENEAEPFQILLIHDSMYEQIDVTVTQAVYRNRVIIFGMGMPIEHLVEITGNRCREEVKHAESPVYRQYAYEMFITFEYVAEIGDESLRPLVDEMTFRDVQWEL